MQAAQTPSKPSFLRSLLHRWHVKFYKSFLYDTSIEGRHGSIKIVRVSIPDNGAEFVARIESALLLLGNVYPRGYRRVRRELDYIVDSALLSIGQYNQALRDCRIDFKKVKRYASDQTEEWTVAYLACIILHEATHGHLMTHGIPYDETTRARVERLCVREEERFAARLAPRKYTAQIVPPFDEARWHQSWNRTRRQRAKEVLARLRQDLREKPEPQQRPASESFFASRKATANGNPMGQSTRVKTHV